MTFRQRTLSFNESEFFNTRPPWRQRAGPGVSGRDDQGWVCVKFVGKVGHRPSCKADLTMQVQADPSSSGETGPGIRRLNPERFLPNRCASPLPATMPSFTAKSQNSFATTRNPLASQGLLQARQTRYCIRLLLSPTASHRKVTSTKSVAEQPLAVTGRPNTLAACGDGDAGPVHGVEA